MIENTPFCYSKHKVKAIVLGAEPGNFSDHGKTVEIKVAIGIGSGDPRYFDPILKNLESIGLTLKDVYIQNLITTDPGKETGSNPDWEVLADRHIQKRIAEFKQFDPKCKIPVLVIAERIMKYLSLKSLPRAEKLYADSGLHPIPSSQNRLGRFLYPFFRHAKYDMEGDLCKAYRTTLQGVF